MNQTGVADVGLFIGRYTFFYIMIQPLIFILSVVQCPSVESSIHKNFPVRANQERTNVTSMNCQRSKFLELAPYRF